jgi:serine protease Do
LSGHEDDNFYFQRWDKIVKSKRHRLKCFFLVWILSLSLAFAANLLLVTELQAASPGSAGPKSFSTLVNKVSGSVVNISAVRVFKTERQAPFMSPYGPNDPFNEFFRRFFGRRMPKEFKQRGLGSGFIIDTSGHILTNNHVVEKAEEIEVTLKDDTTYAATVVGKDHKTDLALIKIDTKKQLTPLPLGDSQKVAVGDWVVAVGSPFGLGNTVTAGIVSAKFRRIGASAYDDFIQTDASINPGNSGGPLLNSHGEVIGINTAIFSQSGGNIGIGFAVPVNIAKDLLPQLKQGKVVRGWLGVAIQEITPRLKEKLELTIDDGALVSQVTPDSPADKAGIKRGDVVVSFDDQRIEEMHELPYLVAKTPVGETVPVVVVRKGAQKTFKVKIGKLEEVDEEAVEEAGGETPNLGIVVREVTPELAETYNLAEERGIVVLRVVPGSAAAEAGLKRGDIIIEVDQEPVDDLKAFMAKLRKYQEGDAILLLVSRNGATQYLTLEIG